MFKTGSLFFRPFQYVLRLVQWFSNCFSAFQVRFSGFADWFSALQVPFSGFQTGSLVFRLVLRVLRLVQCLTGPL
jgi:hypothetical protein